MDLKFSEFVGMVWYPYRIGKVRMVFYQILNFGGAKKCLENAIFNPKQQFDNLLNFSLDTDISPIRGHFSTDSCI